MELRVQGRWARGLATTPMLVFLGSAVAVVILGLLLLWNHGSGHGGAVEPVVVYCGAGIKAPVEATAKAYEREVGVPVHLQYGPSQALLLQAEVSQQGDLFLPGDDSYIEIARQKGLVADTFPLARMAVVLAVRKGNPKGIRSLSDLSRADVRLGQVQPDAAAAGKLARAALRKAGQWDEIERRTIVFKGTVNDVANDLKLGTIDAGFVWDVLIQQYEGMEAVPIPELAGVEAHVTAGVLKGSKRPEAAERFARYLAAPDKGLKAFKEAAFQVPAERAGS